MIGQYVQLRRSGINHVGLCPFHDEKTPSFNVNSQKQFYHCFGCHESGDVIAFLMKVEGRRFGEVVQDLAQRAGVEVQLQQMSPGAARAAARQRSERQRGLDLNARVARLYRELLLGSEGKPARDYLERRGVGEAVSESFQLGFAPASGSVVTRLLERERVGGERVSLDFAEKLGLVAARRGRPGHHDRFWKRLIFPVNGAGGEVLGFGGRMLGEGDGPKYINTPETAIYRKGEALFGLGQAAAAIRKRDLTVLVEGNLDVVQMHQYGFENTVAPMGTALTTRQVEFLRRLAPRLVAIFDGDSAGQAAAMKAIPLLVQVGVEASIATLPADHDPDSLLRAEGREGLERLLEAALPALDFMINRLHDQMQDSIPGRARVVEQVAPVISRLSSAVARELYAARLASTLGVNPQAVMRAIRGQRVALEPEPARQPRQAPSRALTPIELAEVKILGILLEHPHLVPRAEKAMISRLLTNDGLRTTYEAARQMQQTTGSIDAVTLLQSAPEEVRDVVAKEIGAGAFATDGDPTRALDDCVKKLEQGGIQRELKDVRKQMAAAQRSGDLENVRILALRQVELERKIHETR